MSQLGNLGPTVDALPWPIESIHRRRTFSGLPAVAENANAGDTMVVRTDQDIHVVVNPAASLDNPSCTTKDYLRTGSECTATQCSPFVLLTLV